MCELSLNHWNMLSSIEMSIWEISTEYTVYSFLYRSCNYMCAIFVNEAVRMTVAYQLELGINWPVIVGTW